MEIVWRELCVLMSVNNEIEKNWVVCCWFLGDNVIQHSFSLENCGPQRAELIWMISLMECMGFSELNFGSEEDQPTDQQQPLLNHNNNENIHAYKHTVRRYCGVYWYQMSDWCISMSFVMFVVIAVDWWCVHHHDEQLEKKNKDNSCICVYERNRACWT